MLHVCDEDGILSGSELVVFLWRLFCDMTAVQSLNYMVRLTLFKMRFSFCVELGLEHAYQTRNKEPAKFPKKLQNLQDK